MRGTVAVGGTWEREREGDDIMYGWRARQANLLLLWSQMEREKARRKRQKYFCVAQQDSIVGGVDQLHFRTQEVGWRSSH